MQTSLDRFISNKKNLVLASIIAIVFVIASTFLIITVDQLETKVAESAQDIRLLNEIQRSSFDVYASITEGNVPHWEKLSKAYDEIATQTLDSDEMDALTDKVLEIKVMADRARAVDIKPIQERLSVLIKYCNQLIDDDRDQLRKLSIQLEKYWLYTHIMLLIACFLSLGLIYLSYLILKVKLKLEKSQEKNSLIFHQAQNCIIISDNKGRITEFNKASEKLFGYTAEEIIGEDFSRLYKSKSDLAKVRETLERDGKFNGEIINQKKDGRHFVSFLSANLVYDEKGNVLGSMGVSRDITKDKEKEQEYENILDNATDIIYTTDINGSCTFVNDAARVQMGYQYRDLINEHFSKFVHKDEHERVAAFYMHQFQQKISETYLEFKAVKKNGEAVWVGQIVRMLPSPTNPKHIIGFQGIVRDIDQRRKAELELKRSEASYRELFENTSELIHSMDPEGNIIYTNNSWESQLGYTEKDLKKLNFFDLIEKAEVKDLKKLIKGLDAKKKTPERSIWLQLKSKKGKLINVEAVVSESRKEDKINSLQLFMRDITEEIETKKSLDQTESKLKLITESINDFYFLWNIEEQKYDYVSHSCKELLNVKPDWFYNGGSLDKTFVHPDDLEEVHKAINNLDKSGPVNIDFRILVGNEEKWVNEKAFPIKNDEGKVTMFSGVMRDVTVNMQSREIIRRQSEEIGRSLSYAESMQENMLLELQKSKKKLDGLFVFFQPKDNISGDFFIVEGIESVEGDDLIIMAVADCTGNGVPAGMLSFLCNSLLKEAFLSKEVSTPADALEYVRTRILSLFKFDKTEYVYDAMNISVCLINPKKEELQFSGGNQPLLLIRDNQAIEVKGTRQHVGYNFKTMPFKNHKMTINIGDNIYLFTDGFYSQFGGDSGKKLMKRNMKDFLLSICDRNSREQKKEVSNFFNDWKGELDQLDDVTLAGYQV